MSVDRSRLRSDMRRRRELLASDEIAECGHRALAHLRADPVFRRSEVIGLYAAVRGELDLSGVREFCYTMGKKVCLPLVVGEKIQFHLVNPDDMLKSGAFGIPAPVAPNPVSMAQVDLLIAPLVAFDAEGNRLGMGGGYYDRALAGRARGCPWVLGAGYAWQQVDALVPQPWDAPLDGVLTDRELIWFDKTRRDV